MTTHQLAGVSGNELVRYTYEPFGGLIYQTQTNPNPMKFAGEQSPDPPSPHRGDPGGHDDLENYYYLRARYYDPAIGRFISRDPLGGGYAYAGNNPVNRVDPSGMLEIGDCDGGLCLFDPDGNIVNTIGPGMTFYVGGDGQTPSYYVVMNGEGQGRALGFEGNHSVGGWIDIGSLAEGGIIFDPSKGALFAHNSPWSKIAKDLPATLGALGLITAGTGVKVGSNIVAGITVLSLIAATPEVSPLVTVPLGIGTLILWIEAQQVGNNLINQGFQLYFGEPHPPPISVPIAFPSRPPE